MNCEECMRGLAGEETGTPGMESHLAQCPACRNYAADLDADRRMLGTLRDVAPAALVAVRRRVSARIARERAARSVWRWSAGLAACLAVVFSVVIRGVPEESPPKPGVAFHAIGPPEAWEARIVARPARRRRASVPAPVRELATATQPLKIKILTGDPDVVIYWLVDNEGGG